MEAQNSLESNEITPDVCRLCLIQSNILKSMFHCSIGSQSYAEIYEICTGFCINNLPELPNRICNGCESKLIEFYNFRVSIDSIEQRILEFQSRFDGKIDETGEDVSMIEDTIVDEDYEVEQIYEDEEEFVSETREETFLETTENSEKFLLIPTVPEADKPKELFCKFIPSSENPKNVKCLTCVDCKLENLINEIKPENDAPVTCECEKIFKNRRSFLKHFSSIHEKKETSYKCRNCEKTFFSIRSRMAHEAKVHSVGLKFNCGICEKKFYRSDHLKEHEKTCNRVVDTSDKFFACAVCLFTFQREDSYKKHLKTAHVGATENDKDCVKRAEEFAKKHAEVSDETGVACSECNKIFRDGIRLNKHVSLFHSNQFWSCEKCDAVFVHRSTKVSHMSKVHGVRKPFECSVVDCNFSCFKRDRFNAHMEKHENPDKKFPCPICQQEFNSYNTMTLHRAKHLTKNTFECLTCSKQFLDKRNFNVHMKLHTGEDLFHCPVCKRGFNRKDHLQKHQKRKSHFES